MDWSKVKVKVQPRSGFDKSHSRKTSSFVGTLKPLLVDELLPNSEFSGSFGCQIQMAPLASDIDPRCDYCLEAFLVPHRLLYGGFESWLTGKEVEYISADSSRALMPRIKVTRADASYLGLNSLAQSLGYKLSAPSISSEFYLNILPFLAYHRIYDDWYRNAKIQSPVFHFPGIDFAETDAGDFNQPFYLPFISVRSRDSEASFYSLQSLMADGVALGALRQRNFDSDMFTEAVASPQFGNEGSITINTSGSSAQLTISAIRAMNSMQQFEERNNLASPRMQDFVKANYGADLSSGVAQRAICIGSARLPIRVASVASTAPSGASSAEWQDVRNPYNNTLGQRGGSAYLDDNSVFHFHGKVDEPCYLFVIGSLVPRAQYSSGIDPILCRYREVDGSGQSDMANPILQNVGLEAIPDIYLLSDSSSEHIFGYTDRYYAWMDKRDFVDGVFSYGESLAAFTPQRFFDQSAVSINTSFLQIPIDFLDEIGAVGTDLSDYGYTLDGYFKYGVSQPLQRYGIPTLQDPAYEHGKTVTLQRNGSRL